MAAMQPSLCVYVDARYQHGCWLAGGRVRAGCIGPPSHPPLRRHLPAVAVHGRCVQAALPGVHAAGLEPASWAAGGGSAGRGVGDT